MDSASLLRLVLLSAIWGASFLFMRVAVPAFGPLALIALRVTIAAVFLTLIARVNGRRLDWRGHARTFLIVGFLNAALPFVLFAYAAQTLGASLLTIFNATTPMFGALIGALWLRVPLTRMALAGLACGFLGVVVLVANGLTPGAGELPTRAAGLAALAALAASASYAVSSAYVRRFPDGTTPFDLAHGSMWAASLLLLPTIPWAWPANPPGPADWATVVALGILCTGAAFLLYFRLIRDIGPTRALTVTFLIPFFGTLFGAVFLGEAVGWNTVLGGLLVIAGIALVGGLIGKRRRPGASA